MKNQAYIIIVIVILLFAGFSTLSGTNKTTSALEPPDENWYLLPGYPNYAPNGMPDFDQHQEESWENQKGGSVFCLPTAVADVLWWLDSKYEKNQNGIPGDGKDTCLLVRDYNAPSTPNPGPYTDDHNFNNVNDNQTPYHRYSKNSELIERLARYHDIRPNLDLSRRPILRSIYSLYHHTFIVLCGAKKLIKDAGLRDQFKVENLIRPSFSDISKRLQNNEGIVLALVGYISPSHKWGHAVALAGINTKDGKIAISDPWMDVSNINPDPSDRTLHNDPQYVSHDIYEIDLNSPYQNLGSWWIPKYFEEYGGAIVTAAIVISEKN